MPPRVRLDTMQTMLGAETSSACGDVRLQIAIDDANAWIDNNLIPKCPPLQPGGAQEEKLPIIERYLAAHFAVIATEGLELQSARRQDIQETYASLPEGQTTRWIALAAAFDPCGVIEDEFTDRRKAHYRVGKGYSCKTGTRP